MNNEGNKWIINPNQNNNQQPQPVVQDNNTLNVIPTQSNININPNNIVPEPVQTPVAPATNQLNVIPGAPQEAPVPAPNNTQINDIEPQNHALNDMNVDGTYNKMDTAPSYVHDPEVLNNMNPKKNTVTITKELKFVIIISVIMLLFIFIMPSIFDLLRNIKYH